MLGENEEEGTHRRGRQEIDPRAARSSAFRREGMKMPPLMQSRYGRMIESSLVSMDLRASAMARNSARFWTIKD